MSRYLPESDFKWLSSEELSDFDVSKISDESDIGYILEVDLSIPKTLHDKFSDYPLAPESMVINDSQLSPYSLQLKRELGIMSPSTKKLVPNLYDKTKYVIHYQNLKLYLSLGLKLTKIHRAISFKQSPWLAPYISYNTEKRKQAKNEFEKSFYKLLNNSVFGKTMENLRNRIEVEIVNNNNRLRKLLSKPAFHALRMFGDGLAAVHTLKPKLMLNKPCYVGFSILDMSKTLMYQFHYNYILPKYGANARLLFTDTDSLTYDIKTPDIYQDWQQDKSMFDTSDYPKTHFLKCDQNKKVLGKMKDEMAGTPIIEFVGLRPKMYSFKCSEYEKQTAKGICKTAIEKRLRHAEYRECLFKEKILNCKMRTIRSFNHELYSVEIDKIALSPFDDKRYVLDDGQITLALGHVLIR